MSLIARNIRLQLGGFTLELDAEFGGRQLKDQPAVRRVVALDRVPAEHVAQCLAQPLSLARVEEDVRADNPHAVMLRASVWRAPPTRATPPPRG